MICFDIQRYEGTDPIKFGMTREMAISILGIPNATASDNDSFGANNKINIGYAVNGLVDHLGFSPGPFELRFEGCVIWTESSHPDPNPVFLAADSEPLERLGFLIFMKLGVQTSGYHNDDASDLAIALFPNGGWDKLIGKATKPVLRKYRFE